MKLVRHTPENLNTNLSWIIRAVRPWHGHILLLTLISVLSTIFSLRGAVCLRTLLDSVTVPDTTPFRETALQIIILAVLEVGFSVLYNYYANRITFRIRQNLQQRLFNTLLNKDYSSLRKKHTGEWMNRIISDVVDLAEGAVNFVPIVTSVLVRFVGTALLLLRVSDYFLPVTLAGIIGFIGMSFLLRKPMERRQREMRAAQGKSRVFFMEVISQMLIVKAFTREEETSSGAGKLLENEFHYAMKRQNLSVLRNAIQNTGMKIPYVAVIILGTYHVLHGRISYGGLGMCMRLLSQIRMPINQISSRLMNFPDMLIAAERLREAESYPDDPSCPVKSDGEIRVWYKDRIQNIVFRDASFSYQDDDPPDGGNQVLANVDLTIPKQGVTAVTGRTGSGKSTLFKLLMSIYSLDSGNKVIQTVDGDETELDASFRRLFCYVPQGNQLLAGTIREIVAFGDEDRMTDDQSIREALDTACALEFVEKLPHGLDTQIKEKGMSLSEGQAQRLAIARAVFVRRPILLLDEATSALDGETERKLLENLKTLPDRTILIATHRPGTLSICAREFHVEGTSVFARDLPGSSG